MATVRILLGIVWLAAIGSSWGVGSSVVNKEQAKRVIEFARSQIGVKETSENSSPEIDRYNAYAGVKAAPWCASFVSYCFAMAGFARPRTAWSPSLFPKDRLVKNPQAGMVLGVYFPELKRIAHCALVEGVKGNWVIAIEGNSNTDGSREGNGVYRKIRHVRTIYRYADWIKNNKKGGLP